MVGESLWDGFSLLYGGINSGVVVVSEVEDLALVCLPIEASPLHYENLVTPTWARGGVL